MYNMSSSPNKLMKMTFNTINVLHIRIHNQIVIYMLTEVYGETYAKELQSPHFK